MLEEKLAAFFEGSPLHASWNRIHRQHTYQAAFEKIEFPVYIGLSLMVGLCGVMIKYSDPLPATFPGWDEVPSLMKKQPWWFWLGVAVLVLLFLVLAVSNLKMTGFCVKLFPLVMVFAVPLLIYSKLWGFAYLGKFFSDAFAKNPDSLDAHFLGLATLFEILAVLAGVFLALTMIGMGGYNWLSGARTFKEVLGIDVGNSLELSLSGLSFVTHLKGMTFSDVVRTISFLFSFVVLGWKWGVGFSVAGAFVGLLLSAFLSICSVEKQLSLSLIVLMMACDVLFFSLQPSWCQPSQIVFGVLLFALAAALKIAKPDAESFPFFFPLCLVIVFMLEIFDSEYESNDLEQLEAKRVEILWLIPILVLVVLVAFNIVNIVQDSRQKGGKLFNFDELDTENEDKYEEIQHIIKSHEWAIPQEFIGSDADKNATWMVDKKKLAEGVVKYIKEGLECKSDTDSLCKRIQHIINSHIPQDFLGDDADKNANNLAKDVVNYIKETSNLNCCVQRI